MQIGVETRVLHISLDYSSTLLLFWSGHVFNGWQTPLAVWQHSHDCAALATANCSSPDKTTANLKTGPVSEKPLTVDPLIKIPICGQLNSNCHILFWKPLVQYGCRDLLCQVWAGLSRMQNVCVHKFLHASKTIQPAGFAAAVKGNINQRIYIPWPVFIFVCRTRTMSKAIMREGQFLAESSRVRPKCWNLGAPI